MATADLTALRAVQCLGTGADALLGACFCCGTKPTWDTSARGLKKGGMRPVFLGGR